ncbi:MAG: BLUF domain-containing protein [Verrucomicrobiota bacterium]
MKLCRLIYKSLASEEILDPEELELLVDAASDRNADSGITGMLVLTGNRFIQVLEGPSRFVNQLYSRIANDKRHSEIELISFEPIDSTLFCDWTMKLMDLSQLPSQVHSLMLKKYSHSGNVINVPTNVITTLALLMDARNTGLEV